jgi:hypothetical protein
MRTILIIITCFLLTFCGSSKHVDLSTNSDSLIVDSIYGINTWINFFKTTKTPKGVTVQLKVINDSSYLMQWGDSIDLKTYPDTFRLDGRETGLPRFKDENKDYILMHLGCGNPCWTGYFLPLKDNLKPKAISEYLDYDLDNNLIAYVKDSNVIGVINLKTNLTEDYIVNGCSSTFLGYCIDSLSIKNGILKYKWIPDTKINTQKGEYRTEKIKINRP